MPIEPPLESHSALPESREVLEKNKAVLSELVAMIFLQGKNEKEADGLLRLDSHTKGSSEYYRAKRWKDVWSDTRAAAEKTTKEKFDAINKKYLGNKEDADAYGKQVLIYEIEPGEDLVFCSKCPSFWLRVKNGKISGSGAEQKEEARFRTISEAISWLYKEIMDFDSDKAAYPIKKEDYGINLESKEDVNALPEKYENLDKTEKQKWNETLYNDFSKLVTLVTMSDAEARTYLQWKNGKDVSQMEKQKLKLLLARKALEERLETGGIYSKDEREIFRRMTDPDRGDMKKKNYPDIDAIVIDSPKFVHEVLFRGKVTNTLGFAGFFSKSAGQDIPAAVEGYYLDCLKNWNARERFIKQEK